MIRWPYSGKCQIDKSKADPSTVGNKGNMAKKHHHYGGNCSKAEDIWIEQLYLYIYILAHSQLK